MSLPPKPLLLDALKRLDADKFCSGEYLAEQLHVSRASISLALQQARTFGVNVQSVHGKGYRLPHPIDWLDSHVIQSHRLVAGPAVSVLDVTDSTNTQMLQHPDDYTHGSCLVAECQTGGRGRRGRQWQSTLGGSLAFSLRWDFPFGIARLSGLSLATGIAIIRALRRIGMTQAMLKWPNDVLIGPRKLAGILIETQGDALGPIQAIIGIGLNVRLSDLQRDDIDQPVTDLAEHLSQTPSRNALLAILLDELAHILNTFTQDGFAPLRSEWQSLHAWQDRAVNIVQGCEILSSGVACGVDALGALLIETGTCIQTVYAGDVSLRAAT
ncbi:biotin--[acetyl-CoA-carboxylase] ligase [Leeia oryzae]|uniref:biotin--[acetyl-CoA-carboxylase] ligase n=1 Tax=Leeia oryzae TaxID=356662 RepID=UPI00035DCEDC|nr:biotin--[acetyl-CoA-carboxylase] ligase [Leeia oryzae]